MIQFLGGAVVGVLGAKAFKSEAVRSMVVNGLAKGIILKDVVVEQAANLKDGASDICAEAKEKAQHTAYDCSPVYDCGPDCDCGPACDCGPDCNCSTDSACGSDCACHSDTNKGD